MTVPFARSRLISLFLGGALGDSLGAPIEFADTPELERNFPEFTRNTTAAATLLSDAHLTDDTQVTLWVTEGLVRAHQKVLAQRVPLVDVTVRNALLRWYITQEPGERKKLLHADNGRLLDESRLFGKRSPDNTNLLALAQILNTQGWRINHAGDKATESPGALMRSAPYAVFKDVEECFEYALRGAAITHPGPAASLPAAFFAALLHGLLRDMPWDESYARAVALLAPRRSDEVAQLDAALKTPSLAPNVAALGGGWTALSALAVALCVYKAGLDGGLSQGVADCKRVLLAAVLHSGKSDTIGALVGQLLGAQFGQKILPREWLSILEARGTIEGMASDLYDAWVVGSAHDDDVYPAE